MLIPDFFLSFFFFSKYDARISSYDFKCHNTHCGQHYQDFITCTCFLSHEPNVSKHSRLSSGMCSQLSLDVLWTSDSRRLLRYKAHKKHWDTENKVHDLGVDRRVQFITYGSSLTITNTITEMVQSYALVWAFAGGYFLHNHHDTYMATIYSAHQIQYCSILANSNSPKQQTKLRLYYTEKGSIK